MFVSLLYFSYEMSLIFEEKYYSSNHFYFNPNTSRNVVTLPQHLLGHRFSN